MPPAYLKNHALTQTAPEFPGPAAVRDKLAAFDEYGGYIFHQFHGYAVNAAGKGGGREAVLGRAGAGPPGGKENVAEMIAALVGAVELGVPETLGSVGNDPVGEHVAERPEDRRRKEMAQDVARSHWSGTLAVQDAALGCDYGKGAEASLVVRDFRAHRALDRVRGVGVAVTVDHVDSAVRLGRGPGVIGDHAVPGYRDGKLNRDGLVKTVHVDLVTIGSVGNGPNGLPPGVLAALY